MTAADRLPPLRVDPLEPTLALCRDGADVFAVDAAGVLDEAVATELAEALVEAVNALAEEA